MEDFATLIWALWEKVYSNSISGVKFLDNRVSWMLTNAGELTLKLNLSQLLMLTSLCWCQRQIVNPPYTGMLHMLNTLAHVVEMSSDVLLFPLQVLNGVQVRHSHTLTEIRLSLNMNVLLTNVWNCFTMLYMYIHWLGLFVSHRFLPQHLYKLSSCSCWIALDFEPCTKKGMSCQFLSTKSLWFNW